VDVPRAPVAVPFRARRVGSVVLPYADAHLSWAAAAMALLSFGVYLRTLMPATFFWDSGEAQTVPYTLSIFHPTGFPTYALIGWLWSHVVPFGEVAWRMNLLSAVCLALSTGLVALITGHLIDERHRGLRATAAAIAAAVFAFATESWTVAVRADVHALNILFVTLLLWLLFCWRAACWSGAHRSGRWLLAAAFVFGVAMGDHPLVGLMAFGIVVWLFLVDPQIWRRWRLIAGCAVLLVVGLATYLYIPIRALIPPEPPLFYARPTTLERMRYLVFAEQFHNLFGFDTLFYDLSDKWLKATDVLQRQFLGPGWVVAAVGASTLAVRQLGSFVFLGLVVLADVVYSMNFNDGDIDRYYLPTIAVASALIGVAIAMAAVAIARTAAQASRTVTGQRGRRRAASAVAIVVVCLGMLLPAITLAANYQPNDQSGNRDADRWVASVYAALPRDAVIISWWSYSTPLWYHRWVLGERPDITIIDDRNILDDGYVTIGEAISTFLPTRPVYVVPAEWDREQVMATFSTEWVATLPGYTQLLRIKEQAVP
jgi:Protein of unknown function (DUF2723)